MGKKEKVRTKGRSFFIILKNGCVKLTENRRVTRQGFTAPVLIRAACCSDKGLAGPLPPPPSRKPQPWGSQVIIGELHKVC